MGAGIVEGQVRGVQQRSELQGENYQTTVWTFRVERYDEDGNRSLLVPVEMRGRTFRGSVSDGDWVRAQGRVRDGTLHAGEVRNLTTGAVVRAKDVPKAVTVVLLAIFAAVLVAAVGFIIFLASQIINDPGRPEGPADFPGSFQSEGFGDFPPELPGELPELPRAFPGGFP